MGTVMTVSARRKDDEMKKPWSVVALASQMPVSLAGCCVHTGGPRRAALRELPGGLLSADVSLGWNGLLIMLGG